MNIKWIKFKSGKAIDSFFAKYPPETRFKIKREQTILQSGDRGWREFYFLNDEPVVKTEVANNHSYSRAWHV